MACFRMKLTCFCFISFQLWWLMDPKSVPICWWWAWGSFSFGTQIDRIIRVNWACVHLRCSNCIKFEMDAMRVLETNVAWLLRLIANDGLEMSNANGCVPSNQVRADFYSESIGSLFHFYSKMFAQHFHLSFGHVSSSTIYFFPFLILYWNCVHCLSFVTWLWVCHMLKIVDCELMYFHFVSLATGNIYKFDSKLTQSEIDARPLITFLRFSCYFWWWCCCCCCCFDVIVNVLSVVSIDWVVFFLFNSCWNCVQCLLLFIAPINSHR